MSTIQIVGIAAATVIVVLLVIALIVTRKSGSASGDAHDEAGRTSFLDSPPSDTLAKLGAPEERSVPPAAGPSAGTAPAGAGVAGAVAGSAGGGLGLDWDDTTKPEPATRAEAVDDAEATGEIAAVAVSEPEAVPATAPTPEPEAEAAAALEPETASETTLEAQAATAAEEAAADEQAEPPSEPSSEAAPAVATPPEPEAPAASDRLVPLSSIIVTTSTKMVDLDDPEIRRMLTDLVTFEIDQATQFREQGQNLDAVLQLTEAEKVCRALGKDDTAREIRDMMRGLQA